MLLCKLKAENGSLVPEACLLRLIFQTSHSTSRLMHLTGFQEDPVQSLTPPITLAHSPNVSSYTVHPYFPERLLFLESLTLKLEALFIFETSAATWQPALRDIPDLLVLPRQEKHKSPGVITIWKIWK